MPEHFSSDRRRISAGGSAEASYALSQYIDLDAIRSTGQIVDRIYEEHDAVMPKATKVAYEHRQQEFKDWCIRAGYTGDTCFRLMTCSRRFS